MVLRSCLGSECRFYAPRCGILPLRPGSRAATLPSRETRSAAFSADLQPFLYLLPTKLAADEAGGVKLKWAPGEGPFGHSKPLAANPAACTIRPRRKVFSVAECERIVALGESLAAVDAGIEKGENRYRVGRISWIEPGEPASWIFHRLGL